MPENTGTKQNEEKIKTTSEVSVGGFVLPSDEAFTTTS
jgi:hypothetical protein